MLKIKKQFIAGAKCPGCNEIDVVQRCTVIDGEEAELDAIPKDEKMWIVCVDCGHKDFLVENEEPSTDVEPTKDFSQPIKWQ